MSTYWGFVCESHDPPLVSEHWFNHGEEPLRFAATAVRAGTWPESDDEWHDPKPVEHMGYRTTSPIEWLRKHPKCSIALHSEYGDTRPIGV